MDYKNDPRIALLGDVAAFTIAVGFRKGFKPIKVMWLSPKSDEPIGALGFTKTSVFDYRGILIRYKEGTNGRRYSIVGKAGATQPDGNDFMTWGELPFDLPDFPTEHDKSNMICISQQLFAAEGPDTLINILWPEVAAQA